MKQIVRTLVICTALMVPILIGDSAHAASSSDTQRQTVQKLHVTATILPARHIIIDAAGQILKITSNTKEDVTPTAYLDRDSPTNQQQMTDVILRQYREHVPEGTAKYGVLYQRGLPLVLQTISSKQ